MKRRAAMIRYATALPLAWTAVTGMASAATDEALRPFESSYAIIWRGFTAGISSFALRQDPSGQWIYVSRNQPHGLFRLVPKASLTLTSRMSVDAGGVRPLEFTAADPDDGKLQAQVRFDWGALRASGVVEGKAIDMPLHAGVQDDLSIQVAMMQALANGQMPAGISLFDKNGIRDYEYTRVGAETLQTPLGPLPTVIYRSHKANSPRSNRYWCAPELGFVPVQAEQQYNGKVELVIKLQSIHRN
jgi:hypothetical protein